jgi:hypothetical protein
MRSARLSSLLPSRSETRNRHFRFLQIRNSSKRETPLRADSFRTARKEGDCPKFISWSRTPWVFSRYQVQSNQALAVCATLHAQRPTHGCSSLHAHPFMKRLVRCMQSRKLRTAKHVLPCLFHSLRHAPPVHANLGLSLLCSTLGFHERKPGLPAQDRAIFSGIGVLSTQRNSDIVSYCVPWKERSSNHEMEQMF